MPASLSGGAVCWLADNQKAQRPARLSGELQPTESSQAGAAFQDEDHRRHAAGTQSRLRRPKRVGLQRTMNMKNGVRIAKTRHRLWQISRNPPRRPTEQYRAPTRHQEREGCPARAGHLVDSSRPEFRQANKCSRFVHGAVSAFDRPFVKIGLGSA